MKIIVNGQEVVPCKKEKLSDHLTNSDIESIVKSSRRKK
jgi:hypothetical protein